MRIDLILHPYKLQVVRALSKWDREMRLRFCRQFVEMLTENWDLPEQIQEVCHPRSVRDNWKSYKLYVPVTVRRE